MIIIPRKTPEESIARGPMIRRADFTGNSTGQLI